MNRSLTPRLFAGGFAVAVGLACLQVASVPATGPAQPDYTWDSFAHEVSSEVQATVAGLKREGDARRDSYVRLWNNARVLEETLTTTQEP